MRLRLDFKKILAVIATSALLFNSLAPSMSVLAQEVTPSPTPTETAAPTPDATSTPTESASPTPSVTATPLDTTSPTPTDTPTPTATATPSETTTPEPSLTATPTVSPSATPVSTPSITTDKADYQPGETATITGQFFQALQNLVVKIFGGSTTDGTYTESNFNVTTDATGSFTLAYLLDSVFRPLYTVQTFDATGNNVAQTTFTDSSIGTYDQCSNDTGTGYTNGDTGCRWINGNLQANNSKYFEHDATVQRAWLTGFTPNTQHTVTFKYGTTKGGKHAYDFLTEWNHSENWVSDADRCQDITGCTSAPDVTFAIPHDPNTEGHETAGRVFTMRGGTINAISTPVIGSGTYAGDSETVITVTFTTSSSGAMCSTKQGVTTCDVALWFGAHVSSQADWGQGNSAVNITGSPYHVALASIDNVDQTQGGGRDNQMQSATIIQPSTITIRKVTSPGGGTGFAFTTTGTGYTGFTLDDGQQNQQSVSPGSFSVTETNPGPTYANKALSCTASGTGSSATPTLGTRSVAITIGSAGGAAIDCTYTNTLQTGTLKVIKHVINDSGGAAVAGDFSLHVKSGANEVTGSPQAGVESPGTSYTLVGGSYNVSETGLPSGYSNVTTDNTNGDCDASGNVTVVAGQTKTCTITNDDNAPQLHLRKTITNDNGGTAAATDWTLTADGTGANDLTGTTPVDSGAGLKTDTFALSESGASGYTSGAWDCGGATMPDDTHVTVPLGGNVTCTTNNDDQTAHLKLVKDVTNDNGGTAVATDFTLSADGPTPISGAGGAESDVNAGTYNLSETNLPGYTAGEWSCVGGSQNGASVTLALGQSATCTINNDDQQAYITVVKVVNNNHGGTASPDDFSLTLGGKAATSGVAIAVNPGTYTAGETQLSGYTFDGFSGDCDSSGDTTVALGESKTCTLTNSDIQPQLTVIKHVINNNGGTAEAGNFTMGVFGTNVSDNSFAGAEDPGTTVTLDAGSFVVSEDGLPGYAASFSGDCDGTIAIGETKTCTITNDDIAPKLHLRKVVVNNNGGTAVETAWTLGADGTGANDLSGVTPVDSGDGLKADTFVLGESGGPSGYSASDWVCVGGTQNGSSITLGLDEEATCTITNNDIAPKLHLRKVVVNDNGGTALGTAWTLNADGTDTNDLTGTTPVDSSDGLIADTFALSETGGPSGYDASAWVCVGGVQNGSNITVGIGEEATCTITNDDQLAHLIVIKHVINDDGDVAAASDFTMHLTGTNLSNNDFPGSESGVTVDLNAGAYTADETYNNGYVKTLSTDCSGTIANGETKTCTITNNDTPHATRTLGFWQTHTQYTLSTLGATSWTIGTHTVDASNIFSAFYASIPKKSTGAKRSALDQARIQMLQQWVAAKLNCQAFGCSSGTQTLLANAAAAFAGTDKNLILSYASQLDTYNNSNDALPISGQGKATPKDSQSQAAGSLSYWDTVP